MARKESKEAVKPLLYIAQPDLEEAKLNIQQSYVVKVGKQEQKTKEKEYVDSKYVEDEEDEEVEEFDEFDDEDEEMIDQEQVDPGWVKKPFKAMTNEEKVQFMVNKPHYIPKVECRIRTNNDLFIGYIIAYSEGNVSVKIASRNNNVEIPLKDIESIQMVGI